MWIYILTKGKKGSCNQVLTPPTTNFHPYENFVGSLLLFLTVIPISLFVIVLDWITRFKTILCFKNGCVVHWSHKLLLKHWNISANYPTSNLIIPWSTDALSARSKIKSQSQILNAAEAYFVCRIGPNFQISLIYAFIGCP